MAINAAIEIAKNPESSAKKLAPLVGESIEVNRLLARHPKATAAMLKNIFTDMFESHFDEDTCRHIAQNPNISLKLLRELCAFRYMHEVYAKFPADVLKNPSLELLLLKDPCLLNEVPGILALPECPEFIFDWALAHGSPSQKLEILKNHDAPKHVREQLTPEHFYQDALKKLEQFANSQTDPTIKKCIEIYANTSRPYCVPKFLPFDKDNPSHRLDDQFLCGFPFTSASWPWPADDKGDYKQPVAQINLKKASELLEVDLGSGLLQVWAGIIGNKCLLSTRVIPVESMGEKLDNFYPEHAPWKDSFDGCISLDYENFKDFSPECFRIEWIKLGRMFYSDFQERFYNYGSTNEDFGDLVLSKNLESELEDLSSVNMPSLGIPCADIFYYLDKIPPLHLGGYQESFQLWLHDENILLYHSGDYGYPVAVTFKTDDVGKIVFSAVK